MSKLKNKTAFVTGGSRGIGAGIVRQLAAEGANVIFTYVNSEEKAQALVDEIKLLGVKAKAVKADTGNKEGVDFAIKEASEWGIDILVNSAGLFVTGEIDKENDLQKLQQQWEVNVHGVVHTVRSILPLMLLFSQVSLILI